MITDLYKIVWDLAAKEPLMNVYNGGNYNACALCEANDAEQVLKWLDETDPSEYRNRPTFTIEHVASCPWLRAKQATTEVLK